MSDDLADIYTQLKRSYLRGTGLRLNNEAVRVLYKRADEDAKKVASMVADYLFTDSGAGKRAERLVLETEGEYFPAGGWCKEAVVDAVYRILKEKVKP